MHEWLQWPYTRRGLIRQYISLPDYISENWVMGVVWKTSCRGTKNSFQSKRLQKSNHIKYKTFRKYRKEIYQYRKEVYQYQNNEKEQQFIYKIMTLAPLWDFTPSFVLSKRLSVNATSKDGNLRSFLKISGKRHFLLSNDALDILIHTFMDTKHREPKACDNSAHFILSHKMGLFQDKRPLMA